MKKEHLQFVNLYLKKGYNATTAYMEVYPDSSYDAARGSASLLLSNTNIKALIKQKKEEMMEELGIDMTTQLKQLEYIKSKLIEENKLKDAIKALEVQNTMLGLNAPEKIENYNVNVEMPLFGPDEELEDEEDTED